MTKAILVNWRKYTPYGDKYYQPIFDYFVHNLAKWSDEFDKLYLILSAWHMNNIQGEKIVKAREGSNREWTQQNAPFLMVEVNPSLRYYDAYKEVLPQVKEDLVLFLDNDMVIYRKNLVQSIFRRLDAHGVGPFDVVSIYDTIGQKTFKVLNGKSKFCPYLFATRKDLLMKYLDVEWGPKMPEYETFGKLTEKMLADGIRPCELEEDKTSIYFGKEPTEKGKNLDYYHIRAGSIPALLLAWREHDRKQYEKYLKEQPKQEYLRQIMWYFHMIVTTNGYANVKDILDDVGVSVYKWNDYYRKFKKFHGL